MKLGQAVHHRFGVLVETLETATFWSRREALYDACGPPSRRTCPGRS